MIKDLSEEEKVRVKYIDKQPQNKQAHYEHLYPFLEKMIQKVRLEQETIGENFKDGVDDKVQEQKLASILKKCFNCGNEEVPKTKRNCPMCNVNIKQSEIKATGVDVDQSTYTEKEPMSKREGKEEYRAKAEFIGGSCKVQFEKQIPPHPEYSHFKDEHKFKPPLHVHEPVFVNPCSYVVVAVVLRKIGIESGISQYGTGERQWIVVVCDGLPFNLCRRVISSTFLCPLCKESFNGKDEFMSHTENTHQMSQENVTLQKEFSWVLLQPGPGHVEINMVKGFVELTWDVFWKNMVMLFNFRSETALKYAKKVSDHHKGWTLCRIAREAIAAQLILPFVRDELKKQNPDFKASAFLKYTFNAENPNYVFMCDMAFEILDAVFMYRVGVRCSKISFMDAGRAKFAKVWSGRVHPLYRELEMADSLASIRMPESIKSLIESSMSLNTSGRPYTGEGADFRLEEVNRVIQQWLPKAPTGKDWQLICSNHDDLVRFRDVVFKQMGCSDHTRGASYVQNISSEVNAFRALLRSTEYLLHPQINEVHKSFDGTALDPDLINFSSNGREKRAKYFEAFVEHEAATAFGPISSVPFSEPPSFVTMEEANEHNMVENKPVHEIKKLVEELLGLIGDDESKDAFELAWHSEILYKTGKKAIKTDYIQFYYELNEYLGDETSYMEGLDNFESPDMQE